MNNTNKRLRSIIDRFAGRKVVVWGDIILDEYLFGVTRRISREAPVLVLSYRSRENYLGGGGNAVLNLAALGASPLPVGVLGEDATGEEIRGILKDKGISSRRLISAPGFETPRKTRILAGEENTRKQQILRIDRESRIPDSPPVQKRLRRALEEALEEADALLVSDYDFHNVREDLFQSVLPLCRKKKLPVSLDSRFRLMSFPGPTVITPNEPEAEEALRIPLQGEPQRVEEAGRRLLEETGAEAVALTRGSRGMTLFTKNQPPLSLPVHGTADIVDVTGAGDTVISVLTLALAAGSDYADAARLANTAGGLVVMKRGTGAVSREELQKALGS